MFYRMVYVLCGRLMQKVEYNIIHLADMILAPVLWIVCVGLV